MILRLQQPAPEMRGRVLTCGCEAGNPVVLFCRGDRVAACQKNSYSSRHSQVFSGAPGLMP